MGTPVDSLANLFCPPSHYPHLEVDYIGNMSVKMDTANDSHRHVVPEVVGADLIDVYFRLIISLGREVEDNKKVAMHYWQVCISLRVARLSLRLKLMLELSTPTNLNLSSCL
jgi:hypothetical protein